MRLFKRCRGQRAGMEWRWNFRVRAWSCRRLCFFDESYLVNRWRNMPGLDWMGVIFFFRGSSDLADR